MAFMTQPQNPPHCDHHWVHHHGANALVWIKQCTFCHNFDIEDLNEQIRMLILVGIHNELKDRDNGHAGDV